MIEMSPEVSIEGLLDANLPCMSQKCDNSAEFFVKFLCSGCPCEMLYCDKCKDRAIREISSGEYDTLSCRLCDARTHPLKILNVRPI